MGEFKFNLGDVVKSRINGFTGVVVIRSRWFNNCARYTLEPRELNDGQPIPIKSFDEPMLELVEAGVVAGVAPDEDRSPVELGDVVRDRLTDIEGTVAAIAYDISGCVRYFVQPKGLHEGKVADTIAVDDASAEVVRKAKVPSREVHTGGECREPRVRTEPGR